MDFTIFRLIQHKQLFKFTLLYCFDTKRFTLFQITINNAGSLNSENSSNTTSPGGISLSNSIGNGNSPATTASLGGSPNRSIGFLQLSGTPNTSSTIRLPQQPVQQNSTPLSSMGGGVYTYFYKDLCCLVSYH